MPTVLIETCLQREPAAEVAIMNAVHAALVEAFKIPVNDREVRLLVHAPHRFQAPPDRAHPELFTIIGIDAFAGRSVDAKRKLYRAIVDKLEPLGIPRDHVLTTVRDHPLENWGVRGGVAACDVKLGFEVNV